MARALQPVRTMIPSRPERLFDLLKPCACDLRRVGGGILLLNLLVDPFGFKRLLAGFVGGSFLEQCGRLAYRNGGLVGQLLVNLEGLFETALAAVHGSQRQPGQSGQVVVADGGDFLESAFDYSVVTEI